MVNLLLPLSQILSSVSMYFFHASLLPIPSCLLYLLCLSYRPMYTLPLFIRWAIHLSYFSPHSPFLPLNYECVAVWICNSSISFYASKSALYNYIILLLQYYFSYLLVKWHCWAPLIPCPGLLQGVYPKALFWGLFLSSLSDSIDPYINKSNTRSI